MADLHLDTLIEMGVDASYGVPGGTIALLPSGGGALQGGSGYELDVLGMVRSVTKFATELSTL